MMLSLSAKEMLILNCSKQSENENNSNFGDGSGSKKDDVVCATVCNDDVLSLRLIEGDDDSDIIISTVSNACSKCSNVREDGKEAKRKCQNFVNKQLMLSGMEAIKVVLLPKSF